MGPQCAKRGSTASNIRHPQVSLLDGPTFHGPKCCPDTTLTLWTYFKVTMKNVMHREFKKLVQSHTESGKAKN